MTSARGVGVSPSVFSRILLFDIDGTLLLSGRAGYRALTRAFAEMFGVPRGFDGIPVAGRTDASILSAAMLLRWSFGLHEEADAIEIAIQGVLSEGYRTVEIAVPGGDTLGTTEFVDLIAGRVG